MTKIQQRIEKIDFRKHPYRGIITELAKEFGITKGAISQAVRRYRNPRIISHILKKIEEREAILKKAENRGVI